MKKAIWITLGTILATAGALSVVAARFEEKIRPNTFIGIVPVGNLSRDEATRRLRVWWETERIRELEITVENSSKAPIRSTIGKLGITIDDKKSVAALPLDSFWDSALGSVGLGEDPKKTFELKFRESGVDTKWLDGYVKNAIGAPHPARVKYANGVVTREHEVSGYEVDRSRLNAAIIETFRGEGALSIPIEEAPKTIADEQLDAISDVVSEFSTHFPAGQRSRNTNLNLASGKIDGLILMPGEIFSFNERVGKRTIEDGYKEAPVIQYGRHDTGIGGGICQVSGTLYNAVVYANLKVVQRSNHSLPSAYLALGRDCTVSWPNLDFKFQNSTDSPIAISRTYLTGKLTFRILGKKIQGQEVKLETTGRSSWARGVAYEHDPSLPFGVQRVIDKGSNGHAVTVYRSVYLNGQLQKREVLNSSRYAGAPRLIAINKTAKRPASPPADTGDGTFPDPYETPPPPPAP